MKLKYCLLAVLWPVLNTFAQPAASDAIKPLGIGETVPDIVFTHLYGHPGTTLPLSSFRNKIIILDFWASWCGSCISLFPHLDSLQKQFGDQLQIILFNTQSKVSHDDEARIKHVMDGLEKRTGLRIKLPILYDCPELDAYFPCRSVPQEVWLNAEHKVTAITSSLEITASNLAAFLSDKPVVLHRKKDVLDYDIRKPLFVDDNGGNGDDFISRSILTGYREGLGGMSIRPAEGLPGKVTGMTALNASAGMLVQFAYAGTGMTEYPNNRTIVDLVDKRLWFTGFDSSRYHWTYCYDISCPPVSEAELHAYIRQDVERYFHIRVYLEKRKLLCYVLTETPGRPLPKAKDGPPEMQYDQASLKKFMHHTPVAEIVDFFDQRLPHPLINQTRLAGGFAMDIELPSSLDNEPDMLSALRKAGFTIHTEIRTMKVTIITDKPRP